MSKGNEPAFASTDLRIDFPMETAYAEGSLGLTKREYFAAMAMQGLMASPHVEGAKWPSIAQASVKAAEALLKELEG